MANLKPQIGQLFIQNQENDRSTVGIYISEPTPLEEKNLGNVYAVVEIMSIKPENREIIDIISQSLASAYYQSTDFDVEIAFETALKSLNQKLQQISSEVGEEWVNSLNAIVAVSKGKELHFAQVGNVHAFLMQDNKIIEIGGVTREQINPLKIFSNILSGSLTLKSSVVYCTESILDYISQEKLRKTIADNTVKDGSQYLQNLLNENSNQNNFAAVIIRLKQEAAIGESEPTPDATATGVPGDDSMEDLVGKERATSEILAPSLWPGLKKKVQKIKNKPEQPGGMELEQESEEIPDAPERAMTEPTRTKTKSLDFFQKLLLTLKKIGAQIARSLAAFAKWGAGLFKKKNEYPRKVKNLPNKASGGFGNIVNWFMNLSLPRKILLGIIVILIFVLAQGLIRAELNSSDDKSGNSAQYEDSISQINEKLAEVDNFMLMNNEEGARKLLIEASQLLDTIPTDSRVYKQDGEATANKIQEGLDKVFHVNRVNDPEIAIDYNAIVPDIGLAKVERIGDTIYAFSDNSDAVYQGSVETNEASEVVSATGDSKFNTVTKDSAATALGWTAANTLVQFNPVLEKLSAVGIGTMPDGFKAVDIKVFGSRLYALGEKGEILKFSASGDNYGDGSDWIENGQLNNPQSLAIDGAIYVVDGNGQIKKFFSGTIDKDFQLSEIEPKVESPTVVYTDENITSIYLLDPANKRVLRYNKEGKLTSQYVSDKFDNLIDLVVDEDTGTLYLLNGGTVYKVNI
ncbi:hypothetical protein KKC88_03110 [Patescibacteria group bacterium]|nr:hypothetical protein [Patescibacteria group bacterium]MBU1673411.1 hypothetical protein [Patescibacteria group bacterium]MBU1963315.1 hypothetical protein [Patescibacteria group bacterium]